MMFMRTDRGPQYVSFSADDGETWVPVRESNIVSAKFSPASIARIPSTDDLLLVWNDHRRVNGGPQRERTPLRVAISPDDGKTWTKAKTLEDDPNGWYCYTAIEFVGDRVLLGHCAGDRRTGGLCLTQITLVDLKWIYE
jgi:hypothetical protein